MFLSRWAQLQRIPIFESSVEASVWADLVTIAVVYLSIKHGSGLTLFTSIEFILGVHHRASRTGNYVPNEILIEYL